MTRNGFTALLFVVLFTIPARADELCATSREHTRELRERYAAIRAVAPQRRSATADLTSQYRDGILVIPRDAVMTPYDHPFDLEGKSLVFTPSSDGTYAVESRALEYDERGTMTRRFTQAELIGAQPYFDYDLRNFQFPWGGTPQTKLYVSGLQGIFFAEPLRFPMPQITAASAFGAARPMIAPMLYGSTSNGFARATEVWVNETASSVTITWASTALPTKDVDIQAKLFADGRVMFSYRKTQNASSGLVAVTTGNEAWRQQRTPLVSTEDPASDTTSATVASLAGFVDIRNVDIQRVAGTDLIDVRIRVRDAINRNVLSQSLRYTIDANGSRLVTATVTRTSTSLRQGAWSTFQNDPALTVDGNTVSILIPQDALGNGSRALRIATMQFRNVETLTDSVEAHVSLGTTDTFHSDLSAARGRVSRAIEAFTVPILMPDAVASYLEDEHGLVRERLNNIAIYQTFLTDIIFYASAYSTAGNPGDDNFAAYRPFAGSFAPRDPALLHMSKIGHTRNATAAGAFHVLGHEFAHHWLYELTIAENGNPASEVLFPESAHPAQYVDTRAAFPVYTQTDSSLMGGGHFTQTQDGRWSVPAYDTWYGLSWHELYLMGLARPDEVAPWFYLANTQPALGLSYYAPVGAVVSGQRVDVNMIQGVRSLGERKPGWTGTPREFRIVYVVLDRPEQPITAEQFEQMRTYRDTLETKLPVAMGHRASVISRLSWFTHAIASGAEANRIQFRDASAVEAVERRWSFGDGTRSTETNPTHVFARAGEYDVTLTIRSKAGIEESSTRRVVVTLPNRTMRRR